MLQIKNTLVSRDVIERGFACDLPVCKGICCVEGDAGAPLESCEVESLNRALPEVWSELSASAKDVIRTDGVACRDVSGELVTSIVNGKDCVFTYYDADGTCLCALEKAFLERRTDFRKPISCSLYPIRVKNYGMYQSVNYDRWHICKCGETLGERIGTPLYRFLKAAMIDKFGQEWYDELELVAEQWTQRRER
ncbi:MAG: DUF3109 family protein [Tannerellaceae bacterium]|nr:DUF3109 family protein [Tannerellaceae bacterium]